MVVSFALRASAYRFFLFLLLHCGQGLHKPAKAGGISTRMVIVLLATYDLSRFAN